MRLVRERDDADAKGVGRRVQEGAHRVLRRGQPRRLHVRGAHRARGVHDEHDARPLVRRLHGDRGSGERHRERGERERAATPRGRGASRHGAGPRPLRARRGSCSAPRSEGVGAAGASSRARRAARPRGRRAARAPRSSPCAPRAEGVELQLDPERLRHGGGHGRDGAHGAPRRGAPDANGARGASSRARPGSGTRRRVSSPAAGSPPGNARRPAPTHRRRAACGSRAGRSASPARTRQVVSPRSRPVPRRPRSGRSR